MGIEKNIPLLFRNRAIASPDIIAQASKNEKGDFEYFSYKKFYEDVIQFASGLRKIGVHRGDNVAFISDNRREWLISDLAILSLGATDVPRGTDSMATEIRFIIGFATCVCGIFENCRQLEKVLEKPSEVPLLKKAIIFDNISDEIREKVAAVNMEIYSFDEVMNFSGKIFEENRPIIEAEMEKTEMTDLATIIFTSGTTGTPKGVMLTHENYLAQLKVVDNVLNVKKGDMWLSVLPVWHSFERVVQYFAIYFTSGIAYSKPIAPIMLADFAKIRPQYMCGVPRLWDSLGNAVIRSMKKTGGIKYAMFKFFIGIGKKYRTAQEQISGRVCHFEEKSRVLEWFIGIIPFIFLSPLYALGNVLVFRKIKAKLGGRIEAIISGGGSLQKDVDDFYRAVGLNLLEGYGITEAAPVLSVRVQSFPRSNCVGMVYPSCEVKIVREKNGQILSDEPLPPGEKGLILARSVGMRQIMKGYYNRPDLTAKVIDENGWLNTGDIGMLSVDNEIKITGRAKDTIVLLGGENIEPLLIEQTICSSDYIESCMLLGQDKKYLAALIVPSKEFITSWATEKKISFESYEDFIKTEVVQALLKSEIDRLISSENGFRTCEKVFKFAVLPNSFSVGKELSAKQEMIRYKIAELYKAEIDNLFSEQE